MRVFRAVAVMLASMSVHSGAGPRRGAALGRDTHSPTDPDQLAIHHGASPEQTQAVLASIIIVVED